MYVNTAGVMIHYHISGVHVHKYVVATAQPHCLQQFQLTFGTVMFCSSGGVVGLSSPADAVIAVSGVIVANATAKMRATLHNFFIKSSVIRSSCIKLLSLSLNYSLPLELKSILCKPNACALPSYNACRPLDYDWSVRVH